MAIPMAGNRLSRRRSRPRAISPSLLLSLAALLLLSWCAGLDVAEAKRKGKGKGKGKGKSRKTTEAVEGTMSAGSAQCLELGFASPSCATCASALSFDAGLEKECRACCTDEVQGVSTAFQSAELVVCS
mmetsp:Transcript_73544/g.177930  ORF Transcript_73544/g.177930 Transcript_73544/m.177930 type:complete len:129 (+) Transcript_73544:74-460(+)